MKKEIVSTEFIRVEGGYNVVTRGDKGEFTEHPLIGFMVLAKVDSGSFVGTKPVIIYSPEGEPDYLITMETPF